MQDEKKALAKLEKLDNPTEIQLKEIETLKVRVVEFEEARAMRTKKDRSRK